MDTILRQIISSKWYLGSLIMGVESGDTELAGWNSTMTNAEKYRSLWNTYGGDPRADYRGFKGLLSAYAIHRKLDDPNWVDDPYLAIFGTRPPSKKEITYSGGIFVRGSL